MNKAAEEAVNVGGMQAGQVEWFATSVEAGRFLDRTVQKGDVVLVKGSQSMRMEKVVRDVMAHPEKATELLVRQEEKWQQN
jgi:UDP-N-acetylmuramyl pentapeptide synthase